MYADVSIDLSIHQLFFHACHTHLDNCRQHQWRHCFALLGLISAVLLICNVSAYGYQCNHMHCGMDGYMFVVIN